MDKKEVIETWLLYGIYDLYFSYHTAQTEDGRFDYYSAFFAIMSLEKHLKATILFYRSNEYSGLARSEAKQVIQDIARKSGHDFIQMVYECNKYIGNDDLNRVINRNYDGYNGSELLNILKDSYMETRYPTIDHVATSFPIGQPGVYHNPLASSGPHQFIMSVCEFLFVNIEFKIDKERLLRKVIEQYQHQESFNLFKNIYINGRW